MSSFRSYVQVGAVLALAGVGAAQQTVTITWNGQPGCQDHFRTIVIAQDNQCQLVPNTTAPLSYKVFCNAQQTGGFYQVCEDGVCGACAGALAFDNDACVPNPPQFGSSSVSFTCGANQPAPTPQQGEVVINWFEQANCDPAQETIVVANQDVCQTVPNAQGAGGGYKVTCNAAGTGGTYSVCDVNCQQCGVNTPFLNDGNQCVPNPPQFGSAGVRFTCGQQAAAPAPTTQPFQIIWFEYANCDDEHRTVVFGRTGLPQLVPDSVDASYLVTCNADNSGGVFNVCQDIACANPVISTPFTNSACLANPAWTGSSSVRITCQPPNINRFEVNSNDVAIQWFQNPQCPNPTSSLDQTVVIAPQNFCHVVPNATNAGYKVTCNQANNGGTFSVCTDARCSQCNINTPFNNGQCLENPPNTGSASVLFACGLPDTLNISSSAVGITAAGSAVAASTLAAVKLFNADA